MLFSHGPNKAFLVPDSCRVTERNGNNIISRRHGPNKAFLVPDSCRDRK